MILTLLTSTIIVLGCGYIGIYKTRQLKMRVLEINDFQILFENIKTNIKYLKLPVYESLINVNINNKVIKKIFLNIGNALKHDKFKNLSDIWNEEFLINRHTLHIRDREISILNRFLENFGKTNIENEINNIDFAIEKLKIVGKITEIENQKNLKLCTASGFLLGMLLVILLI